MIEQSDNEKLKILHARAGITSDTVDLLHKYFDAFANLYGILNLADAYKIIEKQNPGMITFDKLDEFSSTEAMFGWSRYYYIVELDEMFDDVEGTPETREIIASYLLDVDEDDYYELTEQQIGKPLYIPKKNELLKYADEFYYEKTPQAVAVEKFLIKKHITGEDFIDVMAEVCSDIIFNINSINFTFSSIERLGIELSESETEKFIGLFYDMANNFRIPSNRGYTPNEIYSMMSKTNRPPEIVIGDNMRQLLKSGELSGADFLNDVIDSDLPRETKMSLLEQLAEITGVKADKVSEKEISKNAPCPCGSGKKYKRCCGKGIS